MGLITELCKLLLKYRCKPSAVASLLTFLPPNPPFYAIEDSQTEASGLAVYVSPFASARGPVEGVKVHKIQNRLGDTIPVLIFEYPGATYTMIHSHGNAADCGTMYDHYAELSRQLRVNVVGYDYTGYGAATGTPSEAATYADIEAVYDFVVQSGICPDPAQHLVLYGQSVGSGPSCKLAASKKRAICAMILHSPIMSGLRVMLENRGPLCCCDIYPNINRIKSVKCPVVIIHGSHDEQVSVHHGQSLHEVVPIQHQTPPLWISGADHNNIVENFGDEYFARLQSLFRSLRGEVGEQAENLSADVLTAT